MLSSHTLCRSTLLAILFNAYPTLVSASGSFLSNTLVREGQVQEVLEHQTTTKVPVCDAPPTGPIETTSCDYETVESVNVDLFANLKELVRLPFFKYFQVDLYRECPFWEVPGSCKDIQCAITTVDESEVPERWRAAALSRIDPSSVDKKHQLPGCYYRDSDFCFLDDNTEGDYFDLSLVPERFTGYAGTSANNVWKAIYQENCFGLSEFNLLASKSSAPVSLPEDMTEALREDGPEPDEQCLEKRVYYKVISGLHASISTHICHEYFNQSTGEWYPNLPCFIQRVASHPERLRYIYFNTVLLLRAVARISPYLSAYDYCSTGTHEEDSETLSRLNNIIDIAKVAGKFDETVLFRGENANIVKEEFKVHFRNVTRIMDCIGCDKCRLWGKVQTTGLATALKILFELDEKALNPHTNANLLQRAEVVALFNTLYRFSESLDAVEEFRRLWKDRDTDSAAETETSKRVPRPSPLAGQSQPSNLLEGLRLGLSSLMEICTDSISRCGSVALEIWEESSRTLRSLFKTSGKEGGPTNPNYGEL
ncbi:hypothetical protein CCMSSC00406_0003818 [Pleurotus cornucopiae]|uniref:Uncharacterized protein n=1 Tax=Pleurotus cornucopiae TaxID=5321 RepID=A0ACB7IT64_PLECO|nr:hypothetical protein CCMSSC00406_0003818 [Pleurotus cornucopiae]